MRNILITVGLLITPLFSQPQPTEYYKILQKDSLYYLLTDKSLLKFYSHETCGDFFLTNYVEYNFPSTTRLTILDDYILTSNGDTISYYLSSNARELSYRGKFISDYTLNGIYGFGPYFFIRSGNSYHLYKIEDESVVKVEDSLFNHPGQYLVFFTYPFVVIGSTVYKYIENYDFYAVATISIGNVNLGITGNTIIGYYYWITDPFPGVVHSDLHKFVIEEPSFPHYIFEGWGLNITQLHANMSYGTLIAAKNLYYMTWREVITTYNSQLAYLPTSTDRATITDNYIFLLGGDTLKYSKWFAGSTFYPFTWTDVTSTNNEKPNLYSYSLDQNYPNPFNPVTTINYEIKSANFATLKIYNTLGEEISTIVSEEKLPGKYDVEFNGENFSSGVYIYRLQSGKYMESKKMILLK